MPNLPTTHELEHPRVIDALIHFGAGQCSELDAYLKLDPRRIVLVEADPELTDSLQARTARLPQVQVRCTAVAGRPGPLSFYRYNLPDAGSVHPATGLFKLFPGLKLKDKLQIEAESPVSLLNELQLDAQNDNILIIDLPGEELPVLKSIQQAQQLCLFHQLKLHCGHNSLYQNGETADTVLQWLREQGFDLTSEDEGRDPDRPCWILTRNTLQLRNRELQQQVERLTQARDEQTQLAAQQKQTIEQLTAERDKLAKLDAERQKQLEQLTRARDEQTQLAVQQKQTIEELTAERNRHAEVSAERQNTIEKLISERDENEHRQRLLDEELVKAESQIELISDILIREKAF